MSSLTLRDHDRPPRWWDSDLLYDFLHSPVAIIAAIVTVALIVLALGAGFISPYDSNDPASANVIDARLPPGSAGMMGDRYLLGTDPQGRDMLSGILFDPDAGGSEIHYIASTQPSRAPERRSVVKQLDSFHGLNEKLLFM